MVWWRCEKGHEWQARLFWRTKMGNGCPYCCNQKILTGYNDLATIAPELVQEWDFDKNDKTPYEVAPNTTKSSGGSARRNIVIMPLSLRGEKEKDVRIVLVVRCSLDIMI